MGVAPYWESIDLRVWDRDYADSWPLHPWQDVRLEHREDISIDTLTVTLSDSHPQVGLLRRHKTIPVPVTLEVNGVFWSGLVTSLTQSSDGEVTVAVSQDTKHAHRLMARARVMAAVDGGTTQIKGGVAALTAGLMSDGAQRTGLPLYVQVESAGDTVDLEVRAEDTVADVVGDALGASSTYLDMRVLLPGQPLPAGGDVIRIRGAAEGPWEANRLAAGRWPHAATNPRLRQQAVATQVTPTPPMSWVGYGTINANGVKGTATRGIAWVPFATTQPEDYFATRDPAGVRVTSAGELEAAQRTGWAEHVTYWQAGAFGQTGDTQLLDEAARAGLLSRPGGVRLTSGADALAYIGAGAAYAWHDGTRWVLASQADFQAENTRRNPTGQSRQTPGVLVRLHEGRDRREIVFSSTPGGGLERWETTSRSPEAAMIHAAAQLDASTLQALKAGTLTATTQVGELTPGSAAPVIGSRDGVPETVEAVDVAAQPMVTIAGTEVSHSRVGGRVNVNDVGPFFYREMNVSVTSSSNPAAVLGREWARAQGGASIQLTPGHGVNTVFGDDVVVDGRTVPGWRPGDRVSFVDGETRVSEVVAGYILEARWDSALSVVPVLGRADDGVLDALLGRVRGAESAAGRALTMTTRRVEASEVDRVVDANATVSSTQRLADESQALANRAQAAAAAAQTSASGARQVADSASATADSAQSTASAAQLAAQEARANTRRVQDTLAGTNSTQTELVTQLTAVNNELQRLGQEPQPSLMLAFVSLSTALWQQQRILDRAQDEFASQNRALIDAQDDLISGVQSQMNALGNGQWELNVIGAGEWTATGTDVSVGGDWVGEAVFDLTYKKENRAGDRYVSTYPRVIQKVNVGTTRTWKYAAQMDEATFQGGIAWVKKVAGVVKKWSTTIPRHLSSTAWTRAAQFTATSTAPHSIRVTIGWDAAHLGATYGVRVVANGSVVKTVSSSIVGPLFPWQNGYREQYLDVTADVPKGDVIRVETSCSHTGDQQRRIRDGSVNIWWVAV